MFEGGKTKYLIRTFQGKTKHNLDKHNLDKEFKEDNSFNNWTDTSLHLHLLTSSMVYQISAMTSHVKSWLDKQNQYYDYLEQERNAGLLAKPIMIG